MSFFPRRMLVAARTGSTALQCNEAVPVLWGMRTTPRLLGPEGPDLRRGFPSNSSLVSEDAAECDSSAAAADVTLSRSCGVPGASAQPIGAVSLRLRARESGRCPVTRTMGTEPSFAAGQLQRVEARGRGMGNDPSKVGHASQAHDYRPLPWATRPSRQPCRRVHGFSLEPQAPVRQLIITASGPDRPGIVSGLSKRILEGGGNVEVSRMTRLAGEFSIIMLVSVDGAVPRIAEDLKQRLEELQGLQISTRWAQEEPQQPKKPKKKFRRIFLRGADNPGLVYNVTEYLAGRRINIENLETATEEAPFGGTTLFTMDGIIAMPLDMATQDLRRSLDVLQNTLGVTIEIDNMDPGRKTEDMNRFWDQAQTVGGASKYSVLAQKESGTWKGDRLI